MNAQYPDNIITRALDSEASAFKRGGLAWIVFGIVAQCVMLFLLLRAQPIETSSIVLFIIFSFFFAWWTMVRGVRQLWRGLNMNSPDDLFRRALTTEPRLILQVNLGTHKKIWTRLFNLIGSLINSQAHSMQNSWDQYGITGFGETVNYQLPCVVVKLTDNQEHRLTMTSDGEKLKELIAALLAYAPHARPAPEPVSTQGDWINESGWRSTMRVVLLWRRGQRLLCRR